MKLLLVCQNRKRGQVGNFRTYQMYSESIIRRCLLRKSSMFELLVRCREPGDGRV